MDLERKQAELDLKIENILRLVASVSAETPETIVKTIVRVLEENKDKIDVSKVDFNKLAQDFKNFYDELPKITSILDNYTSTLAAYSNYRSLKRQEKIAEDVLRSNKIMAWATVALAVTTALTVMLTALHLI